MTESITTETADPPRWFNMDGSRHSIGDTADCSCRDVCRKCGAREHTQGAWGCLLRMCEQCDIESSTGDVAEAGEL